MYNRGSFPSLFSRDRVREAWSVIHFSLFHYLWAVTYDSEYTLCVCSTDEDEHHLHLENPERRQGGRGVKSHTWGHSSTYIEEVSMVVINLRFKLTMYGVGMFPPLYDTSWYPKSSTTMVIMWGGVLPPSVDFNVAMIEEAKVREEKKENLILMIRQHVLRRSNESRLVLNNLIIVYGSSPHSHLTDHRSTIDDLWGVGGRKWGSGKVAYLIRNRSHSAYQNTSRW